MDPTQSVRLARDSYLRDNAFSLDDYAASTFTIRFFGLHLTLPNPRGRRAVVPFHDLHHVATGYGTDFVGEAEVGAWELRAGCTTLVAVVFNGAAILVGLLLNPRRVLRAFRKAGGQTTLYRLGDSYESLLGLDVQSLRARLGIPRGGSG
jgi:hypothetical protein